MQVAGSRWYPPQSRSRAIERIGGGHIEVASPAHFVVVDPTTDDMAGTDIDHLDCIVMAATRASVTDVIVNSEYVVVSGKLSTAPSRQQRLSTLKRVWDNAKEYPKSRD